MYRFNGWFKYSELVKSFVAVIPSQNRRFKIPKSYMRFLIDYSRSAVLPERQTPPDRRLLEKCLEYGLLAPGSMADNPYPTSVLKNGFDHLDIRITSRCNLKCRYCSYSDFANRENEQADMSHAVFRRIIESAKELMPAEIHISGGEPFLHPAWEDFVSEARDLFYVSMVSNGTIITSRAAGVLKQLGVAMAVSLDSIDVDINKANRTVDPKMVRQGIDNLIAAGVDTVVVCTLTRANKDSFLDIVSEYIDSPVVKIGIGNVHPAGRALQERDALMLTDAEHREVMKKLEVYVTERKRAKDVLFVDNHQLKNLTYSYVPVEDQLSRTEEEYVTDSLVQGKAAIFNCMAGNWSLSVNPNGDVAPCPICKDFRLGNVREMTIREILDSSEQLKLLNYLRKIPTSALEVCNRCKYADRCNGGCRAAAYNVTGSWLAPNPVCEVARRIRDGA
jgi:radical SAM protein with 4Fe4S-binding SPASM domain